MYAHFRKDPYFLQRYTVVSFVLLSIVSVSLFSLSTTSGWWIFAAIAFAHSSFTSVLLAFFCSTVLLFNTSSFEFTMMQTLGLVALGGFVGMWSNVLIHNASHNIIKPRWLNRFVGEVTGLQLLSGFPGFAILHMEHHIHADHEVFDPHPNLPGQTFWHYVNGTRARLRATFTRLYQETWQSRPEAVASWNLIKWMLPANRALRAWVLLQILGPSIFIFGFMISHIVTQLAFGVINFYSHRRGADGKVEILNLDSHFALKILNRCFAGAFYHRNHHINPKLFNPMNLGEKYVRE